MDNIYITPHSCSFRCGLALQSSLPRTMADTSIVSQVDITTTTPHFVVVVVGVSSLLPRVRPFAGAPFA